MAVMIVMASMAGEPPCDTTSLHTASYNPFLVSIHTVVFVCLAQAYQSVSPSNATSVCRYLYTFEETAHVVWPCGFAKPCMHYASWHICGTVRSEQQMLLLHKHKHPLLAATLQNRNLCSPHPPWILLGVNEDLLQCMHW